VNFLTTKNTTLKLHDPPKNYFQILFSTMIILNLMIKKRPPTFSKLKK